MNATTNRRRIARQFFFASGIGLFIFVPFALGAAITRNWGVLEGGIVAAAWFVGIFWGVWAVSNVVFSRKYAAALRIPAKELPGAATSDGKVLRDVFQAPGTVEYRNGVFILRPVIGKPEQISLGEIESFRMSPNFNGRWTPGRIAIALRTANHWRLGFTVKTIEPWRSILPSASEDRAFEDGGGWIWK